MTVATQPITLEDFLNYDDGSDRRYELVNGELVPRPTESDRNNRIASLLFAQFLKLGLPFYRLRIGAQIAVSGARASARQPDFMVLSEDTASALENARHCLVTFDMLSPQLVIEVVSLQQESWDYRYKRTEYAGRQILEYWIVDPIAQKVTVLEWVDGLYEAQVFEGEQAIVSSQFPSL